MHKRGHLFLARVAIPPIFILGNDPFYFTCNVSGRNIGTCPNYQPESRLPVEYRPESVSPPQPCHSEPVLWVRNLLSQPAAPQKRATPRSLPTGSLGRTLASATLGFIGVPSQSHSPQKSPRKHKRRRPKGLRRRLYHLYPEYQIGRLNRTRFPDLYSPVNQ